MDTKERIKDIITAIAKEDPEAVKAAVHDVLTAKVSAKINPPVETETELELPPTENDPAE